MPAIWDEADEWAQNLNKPWAFIYTLVLSILVGLANMIPAIFRILINFGSPLSVIFNMPTVVVGGVMMGAGAAIALLYLFMIQEHIENDDMEKFHDIFLACLTIGALVIGFVPGLMLLVISIFKLGLGANPIHEKF